MPQCVVTTTERPVYNVGAGYGFSITTIQGIPLLSCVYRTEDESNSAEQIIRHALAPAVAVSR
jgi:hypothetical protein